MNETPKITLGTATHRETPVVKVEFVYNRSQGMDLRFIQELLGHESSGTSEIYKHDSDYNFKNFKNPLDELFSE